VRLRLQVRRFFCLQESCPKRTFAEQLPELLPPRAQRTSRFTHLLRDLTLSLGGRPAARLATRLRLPSSRSTCTCVLRATPAPTFTPPKILRVDDFVFRKGRVYGTILVDLGEGRPIDLLPDRKADTFAAWLQNHPGVAVIVRDRSTEYARGAREGAPNAHQIVDRWHLLANLRETLERLLTRRHAYLCGLPASEKLAQQWTEQHQQLPRPLRQPSGKEAAARQARRTRRYARYEQVRALLAIGLPITQIAQRLGMSWTTARNFASAETFPERAATKPRASQIDRFAPYLEERWSAGCNNASQLWRDVVAKGYTGTRKQVARWAEHQRTKPALTSPMKGQSGRPGWETSGAYASTRLPSPRALAWLLHEPKTLSETDKLVVEHLRTDLMVAEAHELALRFRRMVREQQPEQFDGWLAQCCRAAAPEMQSFARGIRREEEAIRAGLSEPWSMGPVEGQITRLKSIKRQMYGRANLDVLRVRVLHAA
jgi:transposase